MMRQNIGLDSEHSNSQRLGLMRADGLMSSSLPDTVAIAESLANEHAHQRRGSCRSESRRGLPRLILFPLLWFGFSNPAKSAPPPKGITESAGFWTQAVGEGNLSGLDERLGSVRLWMESQGRFNNANPMENMNFYQGMIRTAMGYAVTDRLTVWAGYTYLPTENYNQGYVGEQDAWPAIRYIFPSKLGTVTLREMVEMRFTRGDAPGIRPRTLIKLIHPFEFEPRFGLVVWDEFFFNANNVANNPNGGYSGFNQNRAFAGISWIVNENARLEFGYMNLMANKSKPDLPYSAYNSLNTVSASVFMGW
ncbi:MAG: hypothetical protein RLZZ627_1308 [Pseudomonadota bacterium]